MMMIGLGRVIDIGLSRFLQKLVGFKDRDIPVSMSIKFTS
jgi:hypothetical protein